MHEPGQQHPSASDAKPTVCVLCDGSREQAMETLSHLLRYTPAGTPVLLAGGSQQDARALEQYIQEDGWSSEVPGLPLPAGASFAEALNAAMSATRADLVLLAAGVLVGPGWLERLVAAAYSDSTVGTATALGDQAGPLSVHATSDEQPMQPDAALAVAKRSQQVYPRITAAGEHCVYLRRTVLERLGPVDDNGAGMAEVLAELSLKALALGMVHVAADDVFVVCQAARPAAAAVLAADREDERTPLRRSLGCARTALTRISVTIDARALGPAVGGTQTYVAELIAALATSEALRLRVVVAPDVPQSVARRFESEAGVQVLTYDQAIAGVARTDIVHRPQQVFTADDLALLQLLGERVIIGQQDLIAYRNPAYHEDVEKWQRYRRVTRIALAAADRAVFFSEHAMRDAVSEDLITRERCDVVGIGADPVQAAPASSPQPVQGVPDGRDMLVCLGADYQHKNRVFAIALLGALRERHDWSGCLVLAGPHVAHGSSRADEQRLLARSPDLAEHVIDVGPLDDASKAWLYQRACAVVYPTTYEGFGLVPFEAAQAGKPCLFAPQASLVELAGERAATLVPWDPQLSADAVVPLLAESRERDSHIRLLRQAAQKSSWSAVVERLTKAYERAVCEPYRASAPRAWQELERERIIQELNSLADEYQRAYHDLRANVGIGLPLVCEGGLLNRDEQRGLMRIAARRPLHKLIVSPMALLGRLGSPRRLADESSASDSDTAG